MRKTIIMTLAVMTGASLACSSSVGTTPDLSVGSTQSALVDGQSVWGFETLTGWTTTSGNLALSSQHSQGTYSLALSGTSYAQIASVPASVGAVGSTISVDVQIPSAQPNPYWYGTIQLIVDSPSTGLYNQFIAQSDLKLLTPGTFGPITFPVPAQVQAALAKGASDVKVTVVLNLPSATGTYLLDNLQIGAIPTRKDLSRYTSRYALLVSDQSWQNVLSLVPVATWMSDAAAPDSCTQVFGGATNGCAYPLLVYHQEGSSVDADSTIHFLQQYAPDRVAILGDVPAELGSILSQPAPVGAGLRADQLVPLTLNDLPNQWQSYDSVVYVANDYRTAMQAAVLASHLNVPLVIQQSTLDRADLLTGKQVTCVGDVTPPTACTRRLDVDQAQQLIFASGAPDKVVLTNPYDLTLSVGESFVPEKTTGVLRELYRKMSLIAPYIAAGKHELLLETYQEGDVINVDALLGHEIARRSIHPSYLTIVASPNAIAMTSVGTATDTGKSFYREVDNSVYGRMNDNRFQSLAVGRLMGITLADVASQVARTFFWNRLPMSNRFAMLAAWDTNDVATSGWRLPLRHDAYLLTQMGLIDSSTYLNDPQHTFDAHRDLEDKLIIDHRSHGSLNGWVGGGLSSQDLRNGHVMLSPSLVMTESCLSCAYDKMTGPKSDLFCTNMVRRGAVGMVSAVEESGGVNWMSRSLLSSLANQGSFGQALQKFKDTEALYGCTGGQYVAPYCEPFFVLLGDPTFNPNWTFPTIPTVTTSVETTTNEVAVTVTVPQTSTVVDSNSLATHYLAAPGSTMLTNATYLKADSPTLHGQAEFLLELDAPFTPSNPPIQAEIIDASGTVVATLTPEFSDADLVSFAARNGAQVQLRYSTYDERSGRYLTPLRTYFENSWTIQQMTPSYQYRIKWSR